MWVCQNAHAHKFLQLSRIKRYFNSFSIVVQTMPLFRSTVKSPREVVGALRETLQYLAQHQGGAADGGTAPQKWPAKKQQSGQKRRVSVLQRKHVHDREPGGEFDSAKTAADECSKLLVALKDILLPADHAAVNLQQQQVDETVKLCYECDILLYLVRGSVLEELPSPEVSLCRVCMLCTCALMKEWLVLIFCSCTVVYHIYSSFTRQLP